MSLLSQRQVSVSHVPVSEAAELDGQILCETMALFWWLLLLFVGVSSFQVLQTRSRRLEVVRNAHNDDVEASNGRRAFCVSFLSSLAWVNPVHARGLVQFPAQSLANTYHLFRAGETLQHDIWSTNPLFLTNREDHALSPLGEQHVLDSCASLTDTPTLLKYSLAASCMDTANLIGRHFRMGRNAMVPEFTFLDPRGLGGWDNLYRETTEPAVWYWDEHEAGAQGLGARPPANTDGTPNDTLADQAIRLRQLLSILESQYSGETIVLVFPDGTGPALLSCMIAGIPYSQCHRLEYAPGEVRANVNYETTRALLAQRKNDPAYQAMLAQGKEELQKLRANKEVYSAKDARVEAERVAVEKEFAQRQASKRQLEEEKQQAALEERRRQIAEAGPELSPPMLGLMSAALVGGIGLSAGLPPLEDKPKDGSSAGNVTATSPLSNTTATLPTATRPTERPMPRSQLERPRASGLGHSSIPRASLPTNATDRVALAEQAMQTYLEKDDGEEAWLHSIHSILEETEVKKVVDVADVELESPSEDLTASSSEQWSEEWETDSSQYESSWD